ncbi:hypothetical protein ACXYRK_03845 [Mycoplasma sp. AC1221]
MKIKKKLISLLLISSSVTAVATTAVVASYISVKNVPVKTQSMHMSLAPLKYFDGDNEVKTNESDKKTNSDNKNSSKQETKELQEAKDGYKQLIASILTNANSIFTDESFSKYKKIVDDEKKILDEKLDKKEITVFDVRLANSKIIHYNYQLVINDAKLDDVYKIITDLTTKIKNDGAAEVQTEIDKKVADFKKSYADAKDNNQKTEQLTKLTEIFLDATLIQPAIKDLNTTNINSLKLEIENTWKENAFFTVDSFKQFSDEKTKLINQLQDLLTNGTSITQAQEDQVNSDLKNSINKLVIESSKLSDAENKLKELISKLPNEKDKNTKKSVQDVANEKLAEINNAKTGETLPSDKLQDLSTLFINVWSQINNQELIQNFKEKLNREIKKISDNDEVQVLSNEVQKAATIEDLKKVQLKITEKIATQKEVIEEPESKSTTAAIIITSIVIGILAVVGVVISWIAAPRKEKNKDSKAQEQEQKAEN